MCGILFILSDGEPDEALERSILPFLSHRGPDSQHYHSTTVATATDTVITLHFHGTVLHLRGGVTRQPLLSDTGHMLLWNGEIFGGGVEVPADANDTQVLFDKLCALPFHEEGHAQQLVSLFQSIHGPWAFVFYDAVNKSVWFGRDYFGRRSLMSCMNGKTLTVSSVGQREFGDVFKEIPAKCLYCIDVLKTQRADVLESITTYELHLHDGQCERMIGWHRCLSSNSSSEQMANFINDKEKGSETCCSCLSSNDVGSTARSRASGNGGTSSQCKSCLCAQGGSMSLTEIQGKFLEVFREAVNKRVYNLPRAHSDTDVSPQSGYSDTDVSPQSGSQVGILFSGGIDSVVITALADQCVPQHETIDLINVAFAHKPKVQQNVKKKYQRPWNEDTPLNFNVPDRVTGRTAVKELSRNRKWNFIEVNVTLEELQETRKSDITNLVYPLDSVLDDSIGCAIWFAARGVGSRFTVGEDGELELVQENYLCPAKVLLTGMGADEQLGGYARHRTKYDNLGWAGLGFEMNMELERISSRNLGRDDRCISDHGREARFPFLDENVVAFLKRIPVCVKCDPRLPRGCGEKILLREVAASLGLQYASNLPKRAIQFGSKIAKLEGSKEKGSDNCKRLESELVIK